MQKSRQKRNLLPLRVVERLRPENTPNFLNANFCAKLRFPHSFLPFIDNHVHSAHSALLYRHISRSMVPLPLPYTTQLGRNHLAIVPGPAPNTCARRSQVEGAPIPQDC